MPDWLANVLVYGGVGALVLEVLRALVQRKQMGAGIGKTKADTIDVNVSIAGKVRDEAVEDWERRGSELAELRAAFNQYRADTDARLAELSAQLRGETAERKRFEMEAGRLEVENVGLRKRVGDLEAQVAELKSRPTP